MKSVTAEVQTIDRYDRFVARIYVGDLDVSREMVRRGAAWAYRQYLTDRSLLDDEAEAKGQCRVYGLYQNLNKFHLGRGEGVVGNVRY